MTERTSTRDRLLACVAAFRGRRIAVVGDLVADEFVYGDITRISREAPVLILEQSRTVSVPGGGGNSVANLAALGARPLPIGVVGRDESGRRLASELRRLGVSTAGILSIGGYQTPTKSRILAGGVHTRRQQIVRLDRGSGRGELDPPVRERLARALDAALRRADGLLVADYGYGVASPDALGQRIAAAAADGLPVAVDSRSRVARFRGLTACTPNQEELELAHGAGPLSDDDLDRAARALLRRTGNRAVLVTRGARGMKLFPRARPAAEIPAYGTDEIADVTGAGDTVTAALILALTCGAGLLDAARLANYAAGIVVTKAGTATVSPDELEQAIRRDATS